MKRYQIMVMLVVVLAVAISWFGFAEVLARWSIGPLDERDLGHAQEVESILGNEVWYAPLLYSGVTIEDGTLTVWVRDPVPDPLYLSIATHTQSGSWVIPGCSYEFRQVEVRHAVFGHRVTPTTD